MTATLSVCAGPPASLSPPSTPGPACAPDPLAGVRGTSPWLSISWAAKTERDDLLPQLLERLVRRGMPVIGGPGIDAPMADRVQDAARPTPVIIDYDDDLVATFSGPVIWVLDEAADSLDDVIRARLASPDVTYLLHPRSLPDLVKPEVRLVQVCDASISLTDCARSSVMTLINEPASLPSPMWAVVRFLLSAGGQHPTDGARALLCPPSLLPEESTGKGRDLQFGRPVPARSRPGHRRRRPTQPQPRCGIWPLTMPAASARLLRASGPGPQPERGLSESDDQTGPKDLVRALAWFLTCDPFTSLNWDDVTQLQEGVPSASRGQAHRERRPVEPVRVLGARARPRLRAAARQRPARQPGPRLHSGRAPDGPGRLGKGSAHRRRRRGRPHHRGTARAAGRPLLAVAGPSAARARVIQPLLRPAMRADQDWIRLEHRSDAARDILLADPDAASGTRRVSEITITGSLDD